MIRTENDLLLYLDEHQLPYERIEHPPVYTCEQAERYRLGALGVSTKNLFLRDRRGCFYLLVVDCQKQPDLKRLGQAQGASKLHFGPETDLLELLGVTPGAVTVLGLVNDMRHQVSLWIDEEIWSSSSFLCHPLVNTASLSIRREALERFFQITGHAVHTVAVPTRSG